MNQHDRKHYYFDRQDPFKLGYWEKENTNWAEVIISTICLLVALFLISLVLFLN